MSPRTRPPRGGARLFLTGTHTAVVLGLCALLCAAGAVWPPSPRTEVAVWGAASLVLALVAAGSVLARHHPRTPLAGAVLGVAVGAVLVARCQTEAGVVTTSLGLVMAGQAAPLLGGKRSVRSLLVLVLVALPLAMAASPVPFSPVRWLVLALMTVVTSWLVKHLLDALRVLATTDDLTGVLTRAAFDARAATLLHRAAVRGRPASVVCLDVDDFKEVNDTHGHQAGDEVLVRLVEGWRGALERDDLIGRMGGDEFAVVLAGRTAEGAEEWALRASGLRAPADPTWSHGVAQARRDEPVRDALARADAALYARKNGRADAGH